MRSLILISMIIAFDVLAFSVPSAPSAPSGYDEIRTQLGTSCRSSIGGNLQIYGGFVDSNGNSYNHYDNGYSRADDGEHGAFVGFSYSFGGEERIRCDRLAEIETEIAELELQKLKQEVAAFKKALLLQQL